MDNTELLLQRLDAPGPKKILACDGGGILGLISVEILARLEAELRAATGRPALVLADEPTANLDSDTGDGLLALMRDLNQRTGTSFVIATHDSRVMQSASRLVRLKDGAILEDSAHALPEACPA